MGLRGGCRMGRKCSLGKRWACKGDRVGERMWDEEKTFLRVMGLKRRCSLGRRRA